MTITLANGTTETIDLTGTTTYHNETAGSASDVTPGSHRNSPDRHQRPGQRLSEPERLGRSDSDGQGRADHDAVGGDPCTCSSLKTMPA